MAKENVVKFMDLLKSDENLSRQMSAEGLAYINDNYPEGEMSDDTAVDVMCNIVIPFAEKKGFDFTLDDLKEYEADLIEKSRADLSEDELEAVAGGWTIGGNACYYVGISIASNGAWSDSTDVCLVIGMHANDKKHDKDGEFNGASVCFIYGKSFEF